MRLLIYPIAYNPDNNKSEIIREEIIEVETTSEEQLQKTLYALKQGSFYSIEVYKNINDIGYFLIGPNFARVGLTQKRNEFEMPIEQEFYDTVVDYIKLYIQKDGSDTLRRLIEDKVRQQKVLEKQRYEQWKVGNDLKQEKTKKRRGLVYSLVGVVIMVGMFFVYKLFFGVGVLSYNGKETKGIVTSTQDFLADNGRCIKQKIYYDYKIGERVFYTNAYRRCDKSLFKEGDSIIVFYYIKNPNLCKIVGIQKP